MYVYFNKDEKYGESTIRGESFIARVVAIIEQKRFFYKKRKKLFFLANWKIFTYPEDDHITIIDDHIPDWWCNVDFEKNITFKPHPFAGDGAISLCSYQGPKELIDDPRLLVDLYNVSGEVDALLSEIYFQNEGIWLFNEKIIDPTKMK